TSRVEAGNISRKGYAAGLRRSGIPTLPVLARQPKAEGGEDVKQEVFLTPASHADRQGIVCVIHR
ncbi:hypothetical protein, partial [Ferrovum myxofaciens]|uniref:hypothetical protein n=1 Tax=Ferrovum myxofaciens TaxID=416213 RepID=UPI001F2359D3